VVGADAAGGHEHGRGVQLEAARLRARARGSAGGVARGEDRAADAVDGAVRHAQLVDAVPEPQLHEPLLDRGPHPPLERLDEARSGAPRDVKPRHRVAVPVGQVPAALGPADHGEEPHALGVQPRPLLTGHEVDVRGGPPAGPEVLARGIVDAAVEPGAAEPVLQREVGGVPDAHPALLGGVDQEQAAE